jgi:hypothetical protein
MGPRVSYKLLLGIALCGAMGSCIAPDPPSITSDNPDCLIPAIKIGVAHHDQRIIPYLVKDLESDDAAVRMYSIDGLSRITGQDFGYVYYADEQDRKNAIKLWDLWLSQQSQ